MHRRYFMGGAAAIATMGLGGCAALPRSAPLARDMGTAERPEDLEGLVVRLDAAALQAIVNPPQPAFPASFLQARPIDPTRIGVGDFLDIVVWESEGGGLFSLKGGPTEIKRAEVDSSGRLFVPYAGFLKAAGLTLAQLRDSMRKALDPLTLRPQVDVRMNEARSRFVAIQGAVARPGLYPLERQTARLSGLLALAGGAAQEEPAAIEAVVQRGGVAGSQLLLDVLANPELDIALRPGDNIVLTPIRERFIVLGASSGQAELSFPTRPLTLLSAIGTARGLNDFDADPSGVFVLRYENRAVADRLLKGPEPEGLPKDRGRPIAYRVDFSQPEGMLLARDFIMRDGDAIVVSNAPLTELRKALQLFSTVVSPVNTVSTLPIVSR